MNIEDTRFLLSALLQALPTVYSLGLVALFAFPQSRRIIKNRMTYLIFLVSFSGISLFLFCAILNCAYVLWWGIEDTIRRISWYVDGVIILSVICLFSILIFIGLNLYVIYKDEYVALFGKEKKTI